MRSCITPITAVTSEVTTLEGLWKDGQLHSLQQAWIDEQVPQCGYCQSGEILSAKALLDRSPTPTGAEIRDRMESAGAGGAARDGDDPLPVRSEYSRAISRRDRLAH